MPLLRRGNRGQQLLVQHLAADSGGGEARQALLMHVRRRAGLDKHCCMRWSASHVVGGTSKGAATHAHSLTVGTALAARTISEPFRTHHTRSCQFVRQWVMTGSGTKEDLIEIEAVEYAGIHRQLDLYGHHDYIEKYPDVYKYETPEVWDGNITGCKMTVGKCMDVPFTNVGNQDCVNWKCSDTEINCPPKHYETCPGDNRSLHTALRMSKCQVRTPATPRHIQHTPGFRLRLGPCHEHV
jgi:hypothetical protein